MNWDDILFIGHKMNARTKKNTEGGAEVGEIVLKIFVYEGNAWC